MKRIMLTVTILAALVGGAATAASAAPAPSGHTWSAPAPAGHTWSGPSSILLA